MFQLTGLELLAIVFVSGALGGLGAWLVIRFG